MSSFGIEIPDRMRPLIGIRQFMVDTTGVLMSPNQSSVFWNADWKMAECKRPTYDERPVCVRSPNPDPQQIMYASSCSSCGIYAGYSYENLMTHITPKFNEKVLVNNPKNTSIVQSDKPLKVVYGLVAVRGLIVKSEHVMRVEQAKIIAFAMVPHNAPSLLSILNTKRLASHMGVDFVPIICTPTQNTRRKYYGNIAEQHNCEYWEPSMARITEDERG